MRGAHRRPTEFRENRWHPTNADGDTHRWTAWWKTRLVRDGERSGAPPESFPIRASDESKEGGLAVGVWL